LNNNKKLYKYSLLTRVFHWAMAFMILALIVIGYYMQGLPQDAPDKYALYPWHKSFGLILIFLWPMRVFVKLVARVPLNTSLPDADVNRARKGHFILYVLMLCVPMSGYIMSVAGGYGAKIFSFPVVELIKEDKQIAHYAHLVHEYLPWVLLLMIIIHVAAVIKHKLTKNVNLIQRMF
jgi:cytochrome b561